MNLVAPAAAQLVGDQGGGPSLLEAELGMGMQIPAPSRHLVVEIADPVDDRHTLPLYPPLALTMDHSR
jgi:hypothetical protein